ncbi:carbohydrate ABC transporter permease [Microbacterium sp. YY-01]|uniref:carbohydrate ABC transporter permease n=1 Tax=Microbacterium sp. YY-01 TaxID=3421634 RepID=UPI003D165E04
MTIAESTTHAIVTKNTKPPTRSSTGMTGRDRKALRISRTLLWPALAVLLLVTQVPFVVTIYLSFQKWNLLKPGEQGFAGIDNYVAVLSRGAFFSSLWATVLIVGTSALLSLVIGMVLALLLDRKFPFQGVARTLLITPFLMMPAASALIWKWAMLDSNSGMVNWALSLVDLPPVSWNTDLPILTIVITLTWQYTPFMMLILLAGLQSQPQDVLEAAAVDGAGPLRTFFAMTMPHLRQYVELAVLLGVILMLQVFDPVAIMTRGTGGTKTLPYLLYERAFIGLEIGEAAAYGVLAVIVTIIVATIALRLLFKMFKTEGIVR